MLRASCAASAPASMSSCRPTPSGSSLSRWTPIRRPPTWCQVLWCGPATNDLPTRRSVCQVSVAPAGVSARSTSSPLLTARQPGGSRKVVRPRDRIQAPGPSPAGGSGAGSHCWVQEASAIPSRTRNWNDSSTLVSTNRSVSRSPRRNPAGRRTCATRAPAPSGSGGSTSGAFSSTSALGSPSTRTSSNRITGWSGLTAIDGPPECSIGNDSRSSPSTRTTGRPGWIPITTSSCSHHQSRPTASDISPTFHSTGPGFTWRRYGTQRGSGSAISPATPGHPQDRTPAGSAPRPIGWHARPPRRSCVAPRTGTTRGPATSPIRAGG